MADGGCLYHIETNGNQWTVFYMIGTPGMKELKTINIHQISITSHQKSLVLHLQSEYN